MGGCERGSRMKVIDKYKQPRHEDADHFEVAGAGEIEILGRAICGDVEGIHIGVEWGTFGYCGGVISDKEVLRLIGCLQELLMKPLPDVSKN